MSIPAIQSALPAAGMSSMQESLRHTALRRQLNAELVEIGEILTHYPSQDMMTKSIKSWYEGFRAAMRRQAEAHFVLDQYISLLQGILRDPISQAPLDEETYLGSDGITYGQKSLHLFNVSVSEEIRERLPMNPQGCKPFILVRHLVQWLQKRNACLSSDVHEKLYRELTNLKPVKDDRQKRLERIRERSLKLEQEKKRAVNEFKERIHEEVSAEVHQAFDPIRKKLQQSTQEHLACIKDLERRDRERLEGLQLQLNKQDREPQQKSFQEQLNALQEAIENVLEEQITNLEEEIDDLKKDNNQVGYQVARAFQECKQVQAEILETRKALAKRRKSSLKPLFTTLAIVGASVFATWALQGIVTAMGSGFNVSLVPIKGGAELGLGFAF